jgi:hypothetical protein
MTEAETGTLVAEILDAILSASIADWAPLAVIIGALLLYWYAHRRAHRDDTLCLCHRLRPAARRLYGAHCTPCHRAGRCTCRAVMDRAASAARMRHMGEGWDDE